jgi:hypothetical protein
MLVRSILHQERSPLVLGQSNLTLGRSRLLLPRLRLPFLAPSTSMR